MSEPFLYQMAILCSSSNTRVAVALCLLLIFWAFCSDHLISTFLTLFLLVLSPSAVLVIRRIGKADQRASRSLADEKATTESEAAAGSEVAWLESEGTDMIACHSTESSEDSISDDENLIEISLPDGHFVALPNPLQDSVRRHELTELLSEINEEDNLIEIDIDRGSIKCSKRVGIKV